MLAAAAPVVDVRCSRDSVVLWDEGGHGFGCCCARIAGFGGQGAGRTVDQALEGLADELRDDVENWDAEVDEYARVRRWHDRINRFEEPELVSWAREALRSGQILELLRDAVEPPVLGKQ